jgi:hypothetical protein
MCLTSRRDPWKALLATTVPSTWQIGRMPRSRAESALSSTRADAPIPTISPWRRRSNGIASSSTTSPVAADPEARKPEPNHPNRLSEVMSSAERTITRRQRPVRIQSLAIPRACVPLEQAPLVDVFGPRAPMYSANWECPMERTRNRNRRSK